ncbi:MAG: radical SAM protein [Candidatus Electrothrix aestuarii]|uniref:Radical SAM protein n=1 Tax=Candidatus Electrothrix aestuarii TaxID=3062594 RepID=A0AAU8LY30_9BACT|nr:radical SAM protein [Candidatus Electrothrix aestuarii]
MHPLLQTETGTVRKKWKGRLPVALLYPNTYPLAVSNLGFQLLYRLLNASEDIVCERFVYPQGQEPFRSLESSRPLADFSLVFGSISFEHDYAHLTAMLAAGGVAPYAADRPQEIAAGSPLVVLGGVAVFMNPEPLALFADLMVIGEAEAIFPRLLPVLVELTDRRALKEIGATIPGCYVPSAYRFSYDSDGRVQEVTRPDGLPRQVQRVYLEQSPLAAHSELLSPEAELGMYMTELGRGCSRGCRFCAAGFIYRPPRLWSAEAVLEGLAQRPPESDRVGLLGMEMADPTLLDEIANFLQANACSLSFSSLRADRISPRLLELLAHSGLKSVAIAPDGCSERLRRIINKGLSEEDLFAAAVSLVEAGIYTLKLYVMVGLPTETEQDLEEFVQLVQKIRAAILPLGQQKGRLCELILSVNSFVPKPWTPFQYLSFGGQERAQAVQDQDCTEAVLHLKKKIKYLKKAFTKMDNLHIKVDRPDKVLAQAVFSRADRRIAPALLDIGMGKCSFKQAMKKHKLSSWQYAVRPRESNELFCWQVLDHGIETGYLAKELERSLTGKITPPCDTSRCRRCGVCGD